MAAPITASKKQAIGKDTYWLVPTIADQSAPTATEINSASGLNITGFILGEQEAFDVSTSKVALPRLAVEVTTSQGLDQTVWDMPDIVGLFDPQADASDDDKKFWELVKGGFSGFIVRRQNVVAANAVAAVAAQFVDVGEIEIAPATPGRTAADASGLYSFTAAASVKAPKFQVAVV